MLLKVLVEGGFRQVGEPLDLVWIPAPSPSVQLALDPARMVRIGSWRRQLPFVPREWATSRERANSREREVDDGELEPIQALVDFGQQADRPIVLGRILERIFQGRCRRHPGENVCFGKLPVFQRQKGAVERLEVR